MNIINKSMGEIESSIELQKQSLKLQKIALAILSASFIVSLLIYQLRKK